MSSSALRERFAFMRGNRRFQVFAAGNLVNNVGEAMFATALPLLVFHLTGSLADMALLAAATPVAMLSAPLLGALVDHRGPNIAVVPGLALQAVCALALIVYGMAGGSQILLLFLLALGIQLGAEAYQMGWMTGVAGMFPSHRVQARGALNTLYFLSTLLGPALVALLLPIIGYYGLLWCNLASFGVPVAVWLAGVRPPRTAPVHSAPRGFRAVADGWGTLRHDTVLLPIVLASMFFAFAFGPGFVSLIVFRMRSALSWSGPTTSAALFVLYGATFVGSIWMVSSRSSDSIRRLQLVCAVRIVSVAVLGVGQPVVFMVALTIAGVAGGARITSNEMMMFALSRPEALGRITGIRGLLSGAAALASTAVVAPLSGLAGNGPALIFLVVLAVPGIWLLNRARVQQLREDGTNTEAGIARFKVNSKGSI